MTDTNKYFFVNFHKLFGVQTGQIFKMAILHDHDNDYGDDDVVDEEGSARETRRFQSSGFQERDRDIRAKEQTLFTL